MTALTRSPVSRLSLPFSRWVFQHNSARRTATTIGIPLSSITNTNTSTVGISSTHHEGRHFSSLKEAEDDSMGIGDVNVDGLISGVTTEMAQKDPVLASYIRSNFPDLFESEEDVLERPITNWGERRRTAPKPYLNIGSLRATKRCPETEEGSNRCFPMRRMGYIPGVIYGGDMSKGISGNDIKNSRLFIKTPTKTIQSEMDRYRHAFISRVYNLTVYDNEEELQLAAAAAAAAGQQGDDDGGGPIGTVHRVMPRDIQQHPVNDTVYCCNFLRYYPGRPIKIPLTLINEEESPALKRDGYLIPINRFCEVVIEDGVDIPEELEVECTGLKFKEVIRLDRISFPDGVKPSKAVLKHNDWMVGPIHGGRGGGADNAEDGDGADDE